jgi:hypothetical protein
MLAFAQSLKSLSSTPSKTPEIDTSELKSTTGKAHPKKHLLRYLYISEVLGILMGYLR